jgi:hypothetical protein
MSAAMDVRANHARQQPAAALAAVGQMLSGARTASDAPATLDDVKAEVLRIQDEQDRSKTMMDLTRVQPFIEGVEQLGATLRMFAADADVDVLLGHVWGPMRFLLEVR